MSAAPSLGDRRALPDGGSQLFDGRRWLDASSAAGRAAAESFGDRHRDERPAAKSGAWFKHVEPQEDLEDLIHGVLPKRSYVPMFGRHGSAKTFLALDLAARGAGGRPFLGQESERFGTMFCVGEKRARFAKRLEAWRVANPSLPQPAVYFRWGVPNLLDEAAVDAFIDEVEVLQAAFPDATPLGLIVFDTLARCLKHANVSDPDAAGTAIEAINRIILARDVSVMPLAHTAKAEGSLSVKGAGEWEDAADAILRLDRKDNEPVRTVTVAKQSDSADKAAFGFELDVIDLGMTATGRQRTSCVVREAALPDCNGGPRKLRGPALIASEALQYLFDQNVTHPAPTVPGIPSHWRAIKMQDWRDRAFTAGLVVEGESAGTGRTRWSRAIAQVKEAKLVRIEGDWAIPLRPLRGVSA